MVVMIRRRDAGTEARPLPLAPGSGSPERLERSPNLVNISVLPYWDASTLKRRGKNQSFSSRPPTYLSHGIDVTYLLCSISPKTDNVVHSARRKLPCECDSDILCL